MKTRFNAFYDRNASFLLLTLLLADLTFLAIHLFHGLTPYFANPLFNLEADNGYAERYQYLKYVGIMVLLSCLCVKRKRLSFLPWILLFAYFLADDAWQLHEELGAWIAERIPYQPPFRLRTQDLGELLVSAVAGLILLPSFLATYYFGPPSVRKIFHDLLLFLALLLAFAVGVDMVHATFIGSPRIELVLGVIEDGGELIAISLFGWYVFLLTRLSSGREAYLLPVFLTPMKVVQTG